VGAELSQLRVISAAGEPGARLELSRSPAVEAAEPDPDTASLPELRWQLHYGGALLADGTIEAGEPSAVVEVAAVNESIDDVGLSIAASEPDGTAAAITATLRRAHSPLTRAEAVARGVWRGARQQDVPPPSGQSGVAGTALEVMPPRRRADGSPPPPRRVVVYPAVDRLLSERRLMLAQPTERDR
jgi:hypothetical protein